jgi:hypothetical protein
MVNIGIHYVASSNGKAQDYDNDGIPDFIENASGDGNYSAHVGVETDWQNAQTTAGTPDASNSIYDDVDLDGDGIVGRLEALLGLDPITPYNPLTLTQAGSSDLAYVFTFDVPPSLDSSLWRPRLSVDAQDSSGGWAIVALGSGHYQASVMKHSFASGPHMLQMRLHEAMNQPNRTSQSTLALAASGPVTLWNNASLFWTDPLANIFGSALLVRAELDPGVSDYVVRVYDDNQNPLTSWSAQYGTGGIDQQIDLSTFNGGQGYDGDFAYVEIEAHPRNQADPAQKEKRKNVRGRTYGNDTFEFAYGWDESPGSSAGRKRNNMYLNGVINILFDPSKRRYNGTALPSEYTVPPFVMAYPGDQAYLKQDMLNFGIDNFFFSGHGSQETFGSTTKNGDIYAIFLSTEVAGMYNNLLDNNGSWALHGRSFRLVVLNTCYSASSDQWAIAFGISPSLTTLEDFQKRGLPVQAFVGWTSGMDLPQTSLGDYDGYQEALSTFCNLWMQENTLDNCLWFAASQSILQNMRFPMDWRYKIIGYEKITRSAYQ